MATDVKTDSLKLISDLSGSLTWRMTQRHIEGVKSLCLMTLSVFDDKVKITLKCPLTLLPYILFSLQRMSVARIHCSNYPFKASDPLTSFDTS